MIVAVTVIAVKENYLMSHRNVYYNAIISVTLSEYMNNIVIYTHTRRYCS